MPQTTKMHDSDIWGLIVIMVGLMLYRFSAGPSFENESESLTSQNNGDDASRGNNHERRKSREDDQIEDGLREPLLHGDI